MYIAHSTIPDGSVAALCAANGFQAAMGAGQILLDRYYDNQNPQQSHVGNIDLSNNAFCLCAKNRFELAKFLKTFSLFNVTCNQQIGILKGAYYVNKSAILKKGFKSAFAGLSVATLNVKNIAGSTGSAGRLSGFATAANARHELTRINLEKYGFFLLVFKGPLAPVGAANVFMNPGNAINFAQLAAMMGPAFFVGATSDKQHKATPIDWLGVQARRNREAQQDIVNHQLF
jgi:hypothetical protein